MFYSGLSARYYDQFFPELDKTELLFYQKHIVSCPPPALEIGCGTGRLLLPLMQEGLQIEGVDNSAQMLAQCKQKAEKLGLEPIVYQQNMQSLALPKHYGCIYSPLGTFQQLANRNDAYHALRKFYEHLLPDGKLIIYLYLPWHNAPEFGQWHAHEPVALNDGNMLQVHEKGIHDPIAQQLYMTYRYELYQNDKLVAQQQKEMIIRWYSRYEFAMILKDIGFKDISVQAGYEDTGSHDVMLFVAGK